jgi:hypothetical protein
MKTSVEWLLFELSKNGLLPDGIPSDIHNQAKEVEKERLEDAYRTGIWDVGCRSTSFEEYYNRTFKKQEPIKKYPFNEGEAYYLITDQEHIIRLVWDYIAETLYDQDRMYFKTYAEAHNFLLNKDQEQ